MTKKIVLTQGKTATVSDQDYTRINRHKWHYMRVSGYAARQEPDPTGIHHHITIYMHREILRAMGIKDGDHKDGNRLNNVRGNLREVSRGKNLQNRDLKRDNQDTGVFYNPKTGRYQVMINYKGEAIHVGSYRTRIEARRAYDKAAVKYYGPEARTNKKG